MTSRSPGIRKRVWTTSPSSTNVAELARDAQGAIDAVDAKLQIATFENVAWVPPLFIDTGGRCPDAVIPGSAQAVGAPIFASFAAGGLSWDFTTGKVRVMSAPSLLTGTLYNFSILLFFGGG